MILFEAYITRAEAVTIFSNIMKEIVKGRSLRTKQ